MTPTEPNAWAVFLWAVLGLGLVVYAVTGGADLGAGLWSLLARGPRAEQQQNAVRGAIAPIWEANHVWLIFVIVLMFSAFSRAFSALATALHIPLALSLLGIVFRGSAYAFRAYGIQSARAGQNWERVFAWASLITPLCLGLVVGGVASGEIRVVEGAVSSGFLAGWTSPFALAVGCFALALFAMLAAVYLAAESSGELARDFTRRALIMQGISAALAALTFALSWRYAPELHANLAHSRFSWPIQILTAGFAIGCIVLLLQKRTRAARYSAAAQVACVVLGWGLAMDGHFILPDMSLARASTNPQVMPALGIALCGGSLLLAPALFYLYRVFEK
ncbi:MAG TPA: cytochrome d ubiquinol oxidase subunit II [Polyangiaceae bacterium]|nr:cytochrome d ubiquinol oxidase subunit II [Polyangiaceae bacterium]